MYYHASPLFFELQRVKLLNQSDSDVYNLWVQHWPVHIIVRQLWKTNKPTNYFQSITQKPSSVSKMKQQKKKRKAMKNKTLSGIQLQKLNTK